MAVCKICKTHDVRDSNRYGICSKTAKCRGKVANMRKADRLAALKDEISRLKNGAN